MTGLVAKRVERVPEVRRMPRAVELAIASGRRMVEVVHIDLAVRISGREERTRYPVLLEQQIGLGLEMLPVSIACGDGRIELFEGIACVQVVTEKLLPIGMRLGVAF